MASPIMEHVFQQPLIQITLCFYHTTAPTLPPFRICADPKGSTAVEPSKDKMRPNLTILIQSKRRWMHFAANDDEEVIATSRARR